MASLSADPIRPHGGILVERLLSAERAVDARRESSNFKHLNISPREASDVEMLGIGGYSPLAGFMAEDDYRSVVEAGRLASGLPWTIPITLSATADEAKDFREGDRIAMRDESGTALAVLNLQARYAYDKKAEARAIYRTEDEAHPGVAALNRQGEVLLAGPVEVISLPDHRDFASYRLRPAQTRAIFHERGWRRVVGFQTRNPVHRAHEYIQKVAMEICDGLLLHPLVGETKGDDVPAAVRMRCYEVLLDRYYPKDRVLLSVNPARTPQPGAA